jgi:2,3,4,5-tetrahydropyridine-2,6-dicarboxylate N-succinyltransferase
VFVGDKSDIGGGASIMGTLSGGNNHVVSVGEQCLIGANAGTGISLGDGCTIAAGTYIYSGMKVYLYDKDNNPINLKGEIVSADSNIVKAIELNGRSNMLFIRDGLSGKMMMRPNSKVIELNQSLHSND